MTDEPPARQFELLFRTMAPQIRAFARRHVDAAAVDDVVADTFLVVWRRWDAVPPEPDARRAWVYTVARFTLGREHERARRSRERADRWAAQTGTGIAPDASATVDSTDAVVEVLRRLPDAERAALTCVVLDGLSVEQTAERLACSVSAVTSRLSRARARLQPLLSGDATTTRGEADDVR